MRYLTRALDGGDCDVCGENTDLLHASLHNHREKVCSPCLYQQREQAYCWKSQLPGVMVFATLLVIGLFVFLRS